MMLAYSNGGKAARVLNSGISRFPSTFFLKCTFCRAKQMTNLAGLIPFLGANGHIRDAARCIKCNKKGIIMTDPNGKRISKINLISDTIIRSITYD